MIKHKSYVLIPLMLLLLGIGVYYFIYYFGACIAGGGGVSFKDARGSSLFFNEERVIEFSFWNAANPQCLAKSYLDFYDDVTCHYKTNNRDSFMSIKADFIREYFDHEDTVNKLVYQCKIPPVAKQQGIKSLEYYISYKSEGHYNELPKNSELFVSE
jgi:hypothetical protein